MWFGGCAKLYVVADKNGFTAAFDQGNEGHGFGLLGGFIDDDCIEFLLAEKAKACPDARGENKPRAADPLSSLFLGTETLVQLCPKHSITRVRFQIISYFSDLRS